MFTSEMERESYLRFEQAVEMMGGISDDYLYYFDLEHDYFRISESVLEKYDFPDSNFYDAIKHLKKIVYKHDFPHVVDHLKDVVRGLYESVSFECRWMDKSGNLSWINCRGKVIKGEDGSSTHMYGKITELGERKRADNITGFRTHILFEQDYKNKMTEDPESPGFILRIGIDNFKGINEKYGLKAGDDVLKAFAKCLMNIIPAEVRIYRMEGDEFCVFFSHIDFSDAYIENLFEDIKREIEKITYEDNYKIFYTVSIGVIRFPSDIAIYDEMYKKSEFALNKAKKLGKNSIYFFDEQDYFDNMTKLDIQEELRKDVNAHFKGFSLMFQPIMNMKTCKIEGAEALLRWKNEKYGCMSPTDFVPLLEDSGLIIPVGRFVYTEAIKQCYEWQKSHHFFFMHINLSYVQLKKSEIISEITEYIHKIGIDPKYIVLEITESGEIDTKSKVGETVKEIYTNGEGLAIDDFGTGYSNLRYLKDLKVNTLKIDRAFVINSTELGFDYLMIKHITDLAHSAEIKICLEGVETEAQLAVLSKLQPDFIQGYIFGKPEYPDTFKANFMN